MALTTYTPTPHYTTCTSWTALFYLPNTPSILKQPVLLNFVGLDTSADERNIPASISPTCKIDLIKQYNPMYIVHLSFAPPHAYAVPHTHPVPIAMVHSFKSDILLLPWNTFLPPLIPIMLRPILAFFTHLHIASQWTIHTTHKINLTTKMVKIMNREPVLKLPHNHSPKIFDTICILVVYCLISVI
eukprot:11555267-Ditylum_brightwellii.AAC.1